RVLFRSGGAAEFTAVDVSPFVLVKARPRGEEMELVVRCTDEERALHDIQVVARRQGSSFRGAVEVEGRRLRIRLPLPPVPDGALYRGARAYPVDALAEGGGEAVPLVLAPQCRRGARACAACRAHPGWTGEGGEARRARDGGRRRRRRLHCALLRTSGSLSARSGDVARLLRCGSAPAH